MATRSQVYNREVLDLLYLNQPIAGLGDANGVLGSVTAGSLHVGLFTSGGVEIAYTGYARAAIARGASGFSRTNNVVSNVSQIDFVVCPTGTTPQVATMLRIYSDASAGFILHQADLTNPITIAAAHQPIIQAGAITITGAELAS